MPSEDDIDLRAFLSWIDIFGVPKVLKSDGGSQFSSNMGDTLKYLLKYEHLVVVPYHPQGISMAERRIEGGISCMSVGAHLIALVYEHRLKSEWSHYLPLVQRIIDCTVDGPIGTQPGRVILGDIVDSNLVIDLLERRTGKNEIIFDAAKKSVNQDSGWGLCSPHLSKLSAQQVDWNVSWPNRDNGHRASRPG